jgi:hypothetical protein
VQGPHSREGFVEELRYALSGAEGGELTATLTSRRGVFGLIQPTNPVRGLYTEVTAQKAQEAQEVDQGVEQSPSVIPNGVDVLAAEREEGIGMLKAWCEVRIGRTPGP